MTHIRRALTPIWAQLNTSLPLNPGQVSLTCPGSFESGKPYHTPAGAGNVTKQGP